MGEDFSLFTYKLCNATSWRRSLVLQTSFSSRKWLTVDAWLIAGNFSRSFTLVTKGLQQLKKWKASSAILKFILSNQTFSQLKNLNLLLWKTGQNPWKKSDENVVSDYNWGQPVYFTVDCVCSSKSNALSEAKNKREDVRGYDISVQNYLMFSSIMEENEEGKKGIISGRKRV